MNRLSKYLAVTSLLALCTILTGGPVHSQTDASVGEAPFADAQLPPSPDAAPNVGVVEEAAPPLVDKQPTVQGISSEEYSFKVRGLEERVNDLKERIFRSKARLALLKETVLHGSISGSKAILTHRNNMGASFRLEQVIYSLDGRPIFQKTDQNGDLYGKKEIEIFNGSIVPGNHNLSVFLVYRGHGYGLFSYLKGYVFRIRSSFVFNAEEGQIVRLCTVAYEKGGITTDLKERPDIRFEMEILKDEPQFSPASIGSGGTL